MAGVVRLGIVLALLLLAGCGGGDATIDLGAWTLEGADGATSAVALPAHLDDRLPRAPVRFALATRVDLPPAMRGRDLTLAIARFNAPVTLDVDGERARALDRASPDGARRTQRWRVPAEATRDGALDLRLEVERRSTMNAWVDAVPRLTTAPGGGAALRAMRAFNATTAYAALATTTLAGYLYLFVFLTDPTRRSFGWYALTGISACVYPLLESGFARVLVGPFDTAFAGIGVITALVANVHFASAHFGRPRASRAWNAAWLAAVLTCVATAGNFGQLRIAALATSLIAVASITWHVLLLTRLARTQPRPPGVFLLLVPWSAMSILGAPDFLAWVGLGELFGGLRTASLGIIGISGFQAIALSRTHTVALRDADALANERAERIRLLEASNREVEVLNEELRRQIVARSRQLADALARLADADAAPLAPGTVVEDRYEVVSPIGSGGGGAVYLVERRSDRARLAMKVVRGRDPHAIARLAREAQLAAEVKHENVITIVDVDIARHGFLYVVMEYAPGASLRDHAAQYGRVDWAIDVLRGIASGLAAIHAHGVVHRDLKPANVLLVPQGGGEPQVKIADFGIARGEAAARAGADPRLTMTGMLLGTPTYMAPEMIGAARDATAAVDVFSFGVIAYEILAARSPFQTSPASAVLSGERITPPDALAEWAPRVPAAIASLVMRCLSLEPGERPTAREAIDVLQ